MFVEEREQERVGGSPEVPPCSSRSDSVLLILPLLSINSVFRFLSSIDLFLYVHQIKFLVGRKTLKITKQILEI